MCYLLPFVLDHPCSIAAKWRLAVRLNQHKINACFAFGIRGGTETVGRTSQRVGYVAGNVESLLTIGLSWFPRLILVGCYSETAAGRTHPIAY